ncbi:hypothetical protein CYMTET_42553 [Cymbomonas tetramitiformis]|uniref:Uncharacterized protein n=1 Tax=Cymbomonas tetramitiformis TaxID=36881 RepID=A0AAE0C405_9CHLO|nr:hypothetical protein CYMTET_42553 [Cymbomonas tetramitiformis]
MWELDIELPRPLLLSNWPHPTGPVDSFTSKDASTTSIFDLVDVDKEVHPIFNDLLLRTLAIASSGAGPIGERHAKRQLLSSLDTDFYNEVVTPLRLDTELDKISIEEIYTHICEVWWCANPDGPKARHPVLPPLSAAYSGDHETHQDFVAEFDRVLREALSLLDSLRQSERPAERVSVPKFPPPRRDLHSKHGRTGVSFPPSKWRDNANRRDGKFHGRSKHGHRFAAPPFPRHGNYSQDLYTKHGACPAVGGACDSDAAATAHDMDCVVAAFQTAFDEEDDAAFAELCTLHDPPVVRSDPDPFTYPVNRDIGLRAQYAGLTAPAPSDPSMSARLAEARSVLSGLRDATAAAHAAADPKPGRISFGTVSVPQVVVPPPPANPTAAVPGTAAINPTPTIPPGSALAPLDAADPANFDNPFGGTFADRFALQVEQDPGLHFNSFALPDQPAVWGPPLSVIDTDTDSEDDFPIPDTVTVLSAAPTAAPRLARLTTGLLPFMALLGCATAAQGSVVQCTTAVVLPAVHPTWVTANPCSVSPELSPPALPPDPLQIFAFPPPLPFSNGYLPAFSSAYLFWTSGFWPGLWFMSSGIWLLASCGSCNRSYLL